MKMLGNITAWLCMVVRLSQLQDEGKLKDEHASLAKAFCTVKMRETVGYARECSERTASCWITRSAALSPMPKRSIRTKARAR